jgi:hypothetical protein
MPSKKMAFVAKKAAVAVFFTPAFETPPQADRRD